MILIICSISFITIYQGSISFNNAISITSDGNICILHRKEDIESFENKNRPIIYFTHDACKFITVYDENKIQKSLIMLSDVYSFYEQINSVEDLWPVFYSNDKGKVNSFSNINNITIHYEWVTFDSGERYIILYSIDGSQKDLFNIFNIMCYISIILSFIMMVTIIYWRYYNITTTYKNVNTELGEIIK